MSLNYASKISCSTNLHDTIKKTDQILLVVNRKDIQLKSDSLVLTSPPLKMYGITVPRLMSFTYSTIDEIPNDILTAHIGIYSRSSILGRIVTRIDQCFFTNLELPVGDIIKEGSSEIHSNLLNTEYQGLFFNLFYTGRYCIDNPLLVDDHELDLYPFSDSGYELQKEIYDLEVLIETKMLVIGNKYADSCVEFAISHKEKHAKALEIEAKKKEKKLQAKQRSILQPLWVIRLGKKIVKVD